MTIARTSLTIALAMAGLCGSSTGQVNTDDGYEVIAAKSIFLRNRAPLPIAAERPVPPPSVPIEEQFVLRGVVFENDAFRAHFERLDGGEPMRLAVGDKVADGEVAEIGMSGIGYRKTGSSELIRVGPGRNLAGTVAKIRETRR